MFAFHETTRKRICRTAFLAFCVAPTLATGWWIAGHYWPGRKGKIAHELGETLDVHVKLADWREPRPRTIRTSGLVLSEPATAVSLAEVKLLEIRRGGVLAYSLGEVTIDSGQLTTISKRIGRWLSKSPPESQDVRCAELIIKAERAVGADGDPGSRQAFILYNVQGRIDRDSKGRVQAQLIAHVHEGTRDPASALRLTLVPSTDDGSAAPTLTLETQAGSIPARLLSELVPGFGRFGANARFRGAVQWRLDASEPHGVAQGRLEEVDLAHVLPQGSPHVLRGDAIVEFSEMSWRGAQVERLVGSIASQHAQMSRSLVDAVVDNFQCGQGSEGIPADGDSAMVSLDWLAVSFQLNGEGLTFWGNCPPEANMQEGCMAVSGMQPLLVAPRFYNWPLGKLVQTFTAASTAWLPATREAVEMAERLPLPLH